MRKGTTHAIVLIALASVLVLCGNLVSAAAKTITVGPSSCDYTSIQAAISAARSGDTVYVQSGTYEEHIVFKEGVILQGAGRDKVTIRYDGNNPVITVRNITSGKIDGFTIEYTGIDEYFVIWVSSSSLTLSNNVITGAVYAGIGVGDIGSDPLIEDNVIRSNQQDGIFAYSSAKGTIRDNEIYENGYSGIAVAEGAEPLIQNNIIRDNEEDGIFIFENGKGTVRDNEIYENGYSGIAVKEGSEPLIQNNIIRDNEEDGIFVFENGKGTIRDNEIYGNGLAGIEIKEGADPLIEHNTILWNAESGIWTYSGSQPTIKNNIIAQNREYGGINVKGYDYGTDGNPTISYNDVWGNKGSNYEGLAAPSTDISADPRFVDLEGRDFHLRSNSPCIGAGEGGVDMGAHPYKEVNQPPVADFSFSPASPEAGELVRFDASGSSDPDGRIRNYEWAFGDGISGSGRTTTHIYSRNGSFPVKLTVADDDGVTASTTKTIIVTTAGQPSQITSIDFPERIPTGVEAKGMIGFHDPDGDLAEARFDVLEGDLEDFTLDLTEPSYSEQVEGQTKGSFGFDITVDQSGAYRIQVTLIDESDLESKPYEIVFEAVEPNPPVVTKVSFPSSVQLHRKQNGIVRFEDPDGDIVQAQFEILEGDPATIVIEPGMNFDPEVGDRTSGALMFSVLVTEAQTVKLKLTLTDSKGLVSKPYEFAFKVE